MDRQPAGNILLEFSIAYLFVLVFIYFLFILFSIDCLFAWLIEMGYFSVALAGLQLLGSSGPPTLASQVAGLFLFLNREKKHMHSCH